MLPAFQESDWKFLLYVGMHKFIDPPLSHLGVYLREMTFCVHHDMVQNVHSSFVYCSPKLESTQLSMNYRTNKVVYSYNGILHGNQKNKPLLHAIV